MNRISAARRAPPIWLLVLITVSGTMAMHMFVPALPDAAADLGASAAQMHLTISVYIAGLAVGQLFYGPLSDAFGRRPLLLVGLSCYAVGGLVAATAPGLQTLVGARLLQALGGCAGLALGRAIVRDTTQTQRAVRQLALMNLMVMVGPGLAPMVGGLLSSTMGWRAVFWLLTAAGAATLLLTWRLLPETGHPSGRFSVGILLGDYRRLLGSRSFVGYAVGGGCATTSFYAFIAAAPFIFIEQLHRTAHEVGFYLGSLILGMALGNLLTGRLVQRVPIERLMLAGNVLSLFSATALLIAVGLGHLSVGMVLAWMVVYTCGAGMTSPAALTKAVSVNPRLVGSASGLYGFTQMVVAAVCTSLAALGCHPAISVATVLVVASLLGQAAFWVALRQDGGLAPALAKR